jgi:hypothetical protein
VLGKFFHSSFQNELNPQRNVTSSNACFPIVSPCLSLVSPVLSFVLDNTRVVLGTGLAMYPASLRWIRSPNCSLPSLKPFPCWKRALSPNVRCVLVLEC